VEDRGGRARLDALARVGDAKHATIIDGHTGLLVRKDPAGTLLVGNAQHFITDGAVDTVTTYDDVALVHPPR
jgi:hypothetical protein